MTNTNLKKEDAPGQNKDFTIFVNTREKTWSKKEITFREVVVLAFENAEFKPEIVYTVTYTKGEDKKPKGKLTDNQSVKIKNGMIFDVERADKS